MEKLLILISLIVIIKKLLSELNELNYKFETEKRGIPKIFEIPLLLNLYGIFFCCFKTFMAMRAASALVILANGS